MQHFIIIYGFKTYDSALVGLIKCDRINRYWYFIRL